MIQHNELMDELKKISKITNEKWLATLNTRKMEELNFHNRDRDREKQQTISQDQYDKYYGNKKFYSHVQRSRKYTIDWIKTNAHGKIFLDYACGDGENAILAAQAGAALSIGIDISDVSVKNAAKDAASKNLNNTFFLQADAENTLLPNDSIDTIICSGMLHHLDLSYAFPELRRILKPGGKILCIEALAFNPLIRLYRFLTPNMRTNWEKNHILGYKDLDFANHFFSVTNVKHWHILSPLAAILKFGGNFLDKMDILLCKIPVIKMFSWIFTFELVKKRD